MGATSRKQYKGDLAHCLVSDLHAKAHPSARAQRLLLSGVIQSGEYQCQLEKGRKAANALQMVDRDGQVRLITTVHFVKVAG